MDAPMPQGVFDEWKKFKPATTERGRDIVTEIFDSGWLFPLQRQHELIMMMDLARSIGARTVMEIGADKGGGFFHWPACVPTVTKAIAVELRGVPYKDQMPGFFPDVEFCCVSGSSRAGGTVDTVDRFLNGDKIDVLFIDGEKSMVEGDFELWKDRVRPGGLILIHDIVDNIEPSRFFYSLRGRYRLGCIIDGTEGAAILRQENRQFTAWENWLRTWNINSCGVGIVHV